MKNQIFEQKFNFYIIVYKTAEVQKEFFENPGPTKRFLKAIEQLSF